MIIFTLAAEITLLAKLRSAGQICKTAEGDCMTDNK